jgi:hypothetical protein
LLNNKAEAVEFLVRKFGIFGFDAQIWMLIVAFLIAAFAAFVWWSRSRT